MHLPFVTDEDNAQYMCVAVNNGGRAVSKAELYVAERGLFANTYSQTFNSFFSSVRKYKKTGYASKAYYTIV